MQLPPILHKFSYNHINNSCPVTPMLISRRSMLDFIEILLIMRQETFAPPFDVTCILSGICIHFKLAFFCLPWISKMIACLWTEMDGRMKICPWTLHLCIGLLTPCWNLLLLFSLILLLLLVLNFGSFFFLMLSFMGGFSFLAMFLFLAM